MRNVLIIARHEARMTYASTFPYLLLFAMPVLLTFFLSRGQFGGPSQAVPGMQVMFGLFGVTIVGLAFFRDHGWNTWDRLRAGPASPVEVVLGKVTPLAVMFALQQVVLLMAGWTLFNLPWRGDAAATGILIAAIISVETSLGMVAVAFCRNVEELAVTGYIGAIVLAGMGGAITPLHRLPEWMKLVAPVSPVYWMERGFQATLIGSRPVEDVVPASMVLFVFSGCAGLIAVWRYRLESHKHYFN
jgi:ABC-2 type transport system permease protein